MRGTDVGSVGELVRFCRGLRLAVLTGAGCSTESGIPDYRGPDAGERVPEPIRYAEFVGSRSARARYWARSSVGWPRMRRARPNPAHHALARLERGGASTGVITQNVDGLHQAAGSRRVVELHGSLDRVRCLACGTAEARADVQRRLMGLNPSWARRAAARREAEPAPDGDADLAPDGDAAIPAGAWRDFDVPGCRRCGGVLKPDVVFFGESVPERRVDAAWRLYGRADALLVAGSSLTVWSGYRFVHRAAEEERPVAIVNLGPTRGDDVADLRVEGRVGDVLPRLAEALTGERTAA